MKSNIFFSKENLTSLEQIPLGSKVHVIGVSGVAMAPLAISLAEMGYEVSGSDKEFYEPMGGLLKRSKVRLCNGYDSKNITSDLSLVIIGNAVGVTHPEVMAVESQKLNFSCFPAIVGSVLIGARHSIVVAGTHGKTTTSSVIASMLVNLGVEPSYFIGGLPMGFEIGLNVGKGDVSVVEGDEYDSAFFAKVPKFLFYRPKTVIITSVEFDHADIYANLESIEAEFTKLVSQIPKDGNLIVFADHPGLKKLIVEWKKNYSCSIITYGASSDADVKIVGRVQSQSSQIIQIIDEAQQKHTINIPLIGAHNASNALASLLALRSYGIDLSKSIQALQLYKGIRRRQDIRYSSESLILIDDFAHHPTAVNETLAAIKESFPKKELITIFEPRSNSSRMRVFENDYISAFKKADKVILCNVTKRENEDTTKLLDVNELASKIQTSGVNAIALNSSEEIYKYIINTELINAGEKVIVIMSNGGFGGLVNNLTEYLEKNNRT